LPWTLFRSLILTCSQLLLLTTNRTLIYVNGPLAARTRLGE
jgi:hypothetical protein